MKLKGLVLSMSLAAILVLTSVSAQARCGYYYNPLYLPFAVAGAVVGTAAAITTAVVPTPPYAYPAYRGPVYYAPAPVQYGPGYYAPAPGYYGPGRYYSRPVWIPGHHNRYGYWTPSHWR